jgi:MarR family transcriptional regulator for hemolysin
MPGSNVDFLFAVFETQRLLRLYADKLAREYGLTRAQWAVLAKLERSQGQKQAELADVMEMAPISLTRLIDKLCQCGLVERRSDDSDRRVNRLYLTAKAQPMLLKLTALRNEITETALAGLAPDDIRRLVGQLETVKDNVREAVQAGQTAKLQKTAFKEAPHG